MHRAFLHAEALYLLQTLRQGQLHTLEKRGYSFDSANRGEATGLTDCSLIR